MGDSSTKKKMAIYSILILGVFSLGIDSAQSFSKTTNALAEVEIRGGSAHSTTEGLDLWTADKAFTPGHDTGFQSKPRNQSNPRDPAECVPFPITVWYEFPAENIFMPGRVSF